MLISAYWASWEPWYTVTRPQGDIEWTVQRTEDGDVEFDPITGHFLKWFSISSRTILIINYFR